MADRTVSVVLTADVMGYEQAMGRASAATTQVADTGDSVSAKLKSGFQTAGKVAGTAFTVGVGAATTLVAKLGSVGYGFNSMQQDSRAALTAIMKSGEAANAQMDRLDEFTKKSPYSKTVFLDAQQNLLGFGVAAEKVIPALDAVQNAIAAQGKGGPEIQRAVASLAEMNSVGGMTGKTIRELGILGIDAATILGDSMGKTGAEIKKMASKPGGIPVEEIWDPLIEGLAEQFAGATDGIKEQATGAADRIKAAWRDIGGVMMEPFVSKTGGGQAVVWMNEFADALRAVESKTGMVTDAVLRRLDPALSQISPMLQNVKQSIQGLTFDQVNSGLDTLSKYSAPLGLVAGALAAMGTQWGPLQMLGLSLNPVVGAVLGLVAASPQLRGVVVDTFGHFAPAADSAGKLFVALGDLTNEIVGAAAPGIASLGEFAGRTVTGIIDLGLAFVPLLGVLPPVVSAASSLVDAVTKIPTPVMVGAAAFVALRTPLSGLSGLFSTAAAAIAPFTETAARAYSAGLSPLSAGLAGVEAQAGGLTGKLKTAGGALAGAFGNPVMLPLAAALGLLTAGLMEQAQAAAEAERKAQSYASTLDDVTGAVTAATEQMVLSNLEQDGVAAKWAEAGVSAREMVDAVMNLTGEYEGWYSIQRKLKDHYGEHSNEVRNFSDSVIKEQNAIESSLDAKRREVELARDSANANKDAAEARRDAARAAEEAQRAEEQLAAARRSAVDAAYAVQDAEKRFNEALEEGAGLTRDAKGNLDLYSESSRAAIEPLSQWVDGINRGAQALVNMGAPQSEINAYMEESMGGFGKGAESAGAYAEEVQQLARDLGLVPSYTSSVIDMTVEKEAAEQDIDTLLDSVKDADGMVTIQADSSPAIDELLATMGLVRDSEGNVTIDANANPLEAKLLLALAYIDASTGTARIDGDNTFVNAKAEEAVATINAKSGTISIHGADYATGLAESITAGINRMHGTITIGAVATGAAAEASIQAEGSVLEFYSSGGVRRENHVAQIAPAGSWRIWGEPETGGEAYIPLHPAKRSRSVDILSTVADIFDMQVVSKAHSYAQGAIAMAGQIPSFPASITTTSSTQVRVVEVPRDLIVVDSDGVLVGRMRVEADARIGEFASASGPGGEW